MAIRLGRQTRANAGTLMVLLKLAAACSVALSCTPSAPTLTTEPSLPPSIQELDILQLNVQFATPWNPGTSFGPADLPDVLDPQYWPNTEARARAIGKAIACFDIVVLNETTNVDRVSQILHAMDAAAVGCAGKPDRTPGPGYFAIVHGPDIGRNLGDILGGRQKNVLGNLNYLIGHFKDVRNVFAKHVDETAREPLTDDSVTVISRLPIIETNSTVYKSRSGSDSYGAKGVLHVRLARGGSAGDGIDVFATHLQASGGADIRREQLKELALFVEQHSDPQTPVLLLGDFNIPGPYARTVLSDGMPSTVLIEPHANYRDIEKLLIEDLGFVDIGLALREGTNVTRDDLDHNGDDPPTCQDDPSTPNKDESKASYCQRIDYIFVAPKEHRLSVQEVKIEKFDRSPWIDMPTLSDHAGVTARLRWDRVPDPLPNSSKD